MGWFAFLPLLPISSFQVIFTLAFPTVLSSTQERIIVLPEWAIILLIVLSGAVYPIIMELGVELTYPIRSVYFAGFNTVLNNLFTIINLFASGEFPKPWTNAGVAVSMFVMTVMLLFMKEKYPRSDVDANARRGSQASIHT